MWYEPPHGTKVVVTCPRCGKHIDPNDRCEATWGAGRCMAEQGHAGWHWSDMGRGISRWTGLHKVSNACPGRLGVNDDWCKLRAGHDGAHSNGRGTSFSDPIPDDASSAGCHERDG